MNYKKFLDEKIIKHENKGIDTKFKTHKNLFNFQKDLVNWAVKKGKACIFADCGMGKTLMQLDWADIITKATDKNVLILAPLAINLQTINEGKKFNINISSYKNKTKNEKIHIINYEQLDNIDSNYIKNLAGVVLDESSILKNFTGKTRNSIIEKFQFTEYKLCCSATPSPNDYMELGNHCKFLNIMSRAEMLAMFFIHDGGDTGKWRLKGHGAVKFWKWICEWACMISQPSDMGYDNNDFILPKLNINKHSIKIDTQNRKKEGLFYFPNVSLQGRQKERKLSIKERVLYCKKLIKNNPDEQWLIWCNLNEESQLVKKELNFTEITGSDKQEFKENTMIDFANNKIQKLVTKPKIAGLGINWQSCHNIIFLGLSDSYEQYYQAIRRSWRFGQKHEVQCHLVIAYTEMKAFENIDRKEKEADSMKKEMVRYFKTNNSVTKREIMNYSTRKDEGNDWTSYMGDCVEVSKEIESDSIHYSIFSPPFSSLYTYSNSERDMGNSKNDNEFYNHYTYLIKEHYRITMPGRLLSFHCMNIPSMKERDGFIGLKNFRGILIEMYQKAGFIFHSEVCIWKDPLIEAVRTKSIGLMHKQIVKDSAMCKQGTPDYLITMRKPGENPEYISHPDGFDKFVGDHNKLESHGVLSHNIWRRYASPVWMDINQSRTLNGRKARDSKDERHICPLQLDVIERAIHLWSNENDIVFSPFAGIGSEGYCALKMKRRTIMIELKSSYYRQLLKNIKSISDIKNLNL